MSSVYERYPLPDDERKELFKGSILSEVILLACGIVVAALLFGLSTGDWFGALTLGWLADVASKMTLHWAMIILPILMIAIVALVDKEGLKRSASYRKAKLELCQSINGELPRMPYGEILLCMTLAGICEEFLFRYGAIGLLMLLFTLILPWLPAAILATIVSAVGFWAIHAQYRDPWSIALALSGGLILGAGYLATGSLLACMFAHAVYDIAVVLIEQRNMMKDPNYFGGKVPTHVLVDMGKKKEPDQTHAAS